MCPATKEYDIINQNILPISSGREPRAYIMIMVLRDLLDQTLFETSLPLLLGFSNGFIHPHRLPIQFLLILLHISLP